MERDKKGRFIKGNVLSSEHKKKLSEINKGNTNGFKEKHIPWNKGNKKHSFNCLFCDSLKKTSSNRQKFCNSSCSAKYYIKKGIFDCTGIKLQDSHKEKISKSLTGNLNPNWQGGKSFEPYDETFSISFKKLIRKRDNQVCMLCGIHREKLKYSFSVHHINYDKLLSIPENCISLCKSCHNVTNYNRKHWTTFFQNLLSKKYEYKYENQNIIMEVTK